MLENNKNLSEYNLERKKKYFSIIFLQKNILKYTVEKNKKD